MNLNLVYIFSELVTGIAFISLTLIYGYLSNSFDITAFENFIETNFSFSKLLGVSILVYCIGFIFDGIGLGVGELFLDNLLYKRKSIDRKKFFREVSEYVFVYRNKQWAYYSGYRNLFLLIFLFLIATFPHLFKIKGIWVGSLILITIILIEYLVYRTMKMLLKLYYSIEEGFQ
jgi:hypothetical protein